MNFKAPVIPLVVALSVTGVTAALIYLLLKKDEEDLENRYRAINRSRNIVIEVKIPRDCVGAVIGRGGANIKDIQERSHTKINFKDELETEDYRVCAIHGTPDCAQIAESLIHEFIMNQPLIEIVDLMVPQFACGRIIGRGGDTIRNISRSSGAKINIESTVSKEDVYSDRKVIIKGSADQIAVAKSMILDKVEEEKDLMKKVEASLANRTPRNPGRQQNFLMSGEDEQKKVMKSREERLVVAAKDGFMDVYVSALEDPSRFWVQVKGPRAVELDQLVDKMTEYYNQDENKNVHRIAEISINQIVAAPFTVDGRWYRAEVMEVAMDDYDPEESQVSVYYVDYGDTGTLAKKQIFELRTDFLRLRYQAIECTLASVKPSGDAWTNQAIDRFEELTHAAQWKPLIAKVKQYKERTRGKREGSPIPSVELYDTQKSRDINIAEELVSEGHAVWEEEVKRTRTPRKPYKPSPNGTSSPGTSTPPSLNSSITDAETELRNGDVDHDTRSHPYTELGNVRVDSVLPKRYAGTGKFVPEPEEDDELEMF